MGAYLILDKGRQVGTRYIPGKKQKKMGSSLATVIQSLYISRELYRMYSYTECIVDNIETYQIYSLVVMCMEILLVVGLN